jgi:alpha-ribazole phosphatase
MMEILLMRHGRTLGNVERRYVGRTDEPLSPEGIEHARLTGTDGSVRSVYVSPLKRALETARIKFPNAALTIVADLREMDFGDFEGKRADELLEDADYKIWLESNCTLRCPGGEQLDEFADRVCRAFAAIVREGLENGEKRLVVVAHGGSIMSVLSRYGSPSRQYYEWYVDNCGGYRLRLDAADWEENKVLTDCERFESI